MYIKINKLKLYKNKNIAWYVNLHFVNQAGIIKRWLKLQKAIISKKLTYFRKNCEEYPIECSQQLYKNYQRRVQYVLSSLLMIWVSSYLPLDGSLLYV